MRRKRQSRGAAVTREVLSRAASPTADVRIAINQMGGTDPRQPTSESTALILAAGVVLPPTMRMRESAAPQLLGVAALRPQSGVDLARNAVGFAEFGGRVTARRLLLTTIANQKSVRNARRWAVG
jgi:hypothetical protein